MTRRRVNFRGRVQGVGFRMTAASIARSHDVTGWVRNEPDGSVMLEVQGEADAVEGYLEALRGGMGRYIRDSDELPMPPVPREAGFEIRR